MTTRKDAAYLALATALSDGLSFKFACELADKAAKDASHLPQQAPTIMLTDTELKAMDENDLTMEECHRLDDLNQGK